MAYLVGCIAGFSWITIVAVLIYVFSGYLDKSSINFPAAFLVLLIIAALEAAALSTIRRKYNLVELMEQNKEKDKCPDEN